MNLVAKAARYILHSRSPRPAREARHNFLQRYSPEETQALLDELQITWHLYHGVQDDERLLRIYQFYERLSQLLAADYALLKEGRRWQQSRV